MTGDEAPGREGDRRAMIETIQAEAAATAGLTGRPSISDRVVAALAAVPRHRFVPDAEEQIAYIDSPLPIGHGQTISQPYIVALMTDLLDIKPTDTVLEIGTGCGYQAAILSLLAATVYSIERIAPLAAAARDRLAALGYANVTVRAGDGYQGWPEAAPFDAIIVTAAADGVPPALERQLGPGGRMVIPVASGHDGQSLLLLTRDAGGEVHRRTVLAVAFVPMLHGTA
ncbi:MAG: protein-L-isoaspartate(D-aspartate) O-methyltransferase [Rhodospirillales bacterium]